MRTSGAAIKRGTLGNYMCHEIQEFPLSCKCVSQSRPPYRYVYALVEALILLPEKGLTSGWHLAALQVSTNLGVEGSKTGPSNGGHRIVDCPVPKNP